MKSLLTIIMLLAIVNLLHAQTKTSIDFESKEIKPLLNNVQLPVNLEKFKSISDSKKNNPEHYINKEIAPPRIQAAINEIDTITKYFDRSYTFHNYVYYSGGREVPCCGTNTDYHYVGPEYRFQPPLDKDVYLTGVLIAYSEISYYGAPDSNDIVVKGLDYDGSNGKYLGQTMFWHGDMNPSLIGCAFSYVKMNEPILLKDLEAGFVIYIGTYGYDPNNLDYWDKVYIWTNGDGDGKNEYTVQYLVYDNGQWYWGELEGASCYGIDVDIMVLPVIETIDPTGIDEELKFDDVTLRNIYPNPASDEAVINLKIEMPTNIEVSLINSEGRKICVEKRKNLVPGEYFFNMDLKQIPAGSYFYSVITNRTKFAGKISIVK